LCSLFIVIVFISTQPKKNTYHFFLAPDLVGSLHFEDVSDRSVNVVWSPPLHTNGHLTGYTVSYSIRDRPETTHLVNVTSDITSIVIDQLQATTHYKFEVFAWTKVGPGPSRIATIQ